MNMQSSPEADSVFFQLPKDVVPQAWPVVLPGLEIAVQRASGRLSLENIANDIMSGKWQLWLYLKGGEYKALAVTEISTCQNGKKILSLIICTGEDKELWEVLVPSTLEQFARVEGCTLFETLARPGWEKILGRQGFKKTHVLLEKELN
jgi:hypothetical protein